MWWYIDLSWGTLGPMPKGWKNRYFFQKKWRNWKIRELPKGSSTLSIVWTTPLSATMSHVVNSARSAYKYPPLDLLTLRTSSSRRVILVDWSINLEVQCRQSREYIFKVHHGIPETWYYFIPKWPLWCPKVPIRFWNWSVKQRWRFLRISSLGY